MLARNFERDRAIGYTVSRTAKSSFASKANGLPVEDILSRGQLKLLMCALRLAQGEHLMQQKSARHCILVTILLLNWININGRCLHNACNKAALKYLSARSPLNNCNKCNRKRHRTFMVNRGEHSTNYLKLLAST